MKGLPMKTMKKMRTSLERLLFLAFVIVMVGCSANLDENFYHPSETYPDKIPLTVGVKINSLPEHPYGSTSFTDAGKERLRIAILKSMSNVFEKANFVSHLSGYDVLAHIDVSSLIGNTFPFTAETFN